MIDVNLVAVLVASLASFAWGAFFYSQAAAGSMWMKEMGMSGKTMKKDNMMQMMAIGFVATFVMAYVLSHIIAMSMMLGLGTGVSSAFWVWLGFIAPLSSGDVTWGGKTWKLWFINNVHWLVSLLLMGFIIANWS